MIRSDARRVTARADRPDAQHKSREMPPKRAARTAGAGRPAETGPIFVSRALSGPPSSPINAPNHGGRCSYMAPSGEVAEWLNAPHSKCGIGASLSGVRIPPSPPAHSHHAVTFERRKPRKTTLPACPRCASVEACIQQCSPRCSPTEKAVQGPRALAERAGPGADLSGAPAFHVFLPDSAPLKPCSQTAVMRSYSGASWGASASRGAAAGVLAGRAGADRFQPVERRVEY